MKKLSLVYLLSCFLELVSTFTYGQVPYWVWANGETGIATTNTVKTDPYGNVYVAGSFTGDSITLGSYTLYNANPILLKTDLFLAKYNADGEVLWAISAGGTLVEDATSLAVDSWGNVYMTGYYSSDTITFGNHFLKNTYIDWSDVFLVKFSPEGEALWLVGAGGNMHDDGNAVSVDASGNVYITGSFQWSIDFGPVVLQNIDHTGYGSRDVFLAKYDSDGNFKWATSAQGMNYDEPRSLSVDDDGDVYVTGYFNSRSIAFDNIVVPNYDSASPNQYLPRDIFIAKYNTNGDAIWAKGAGGSGNDDARSLVVNNTADIYLTGDFESRFVTFGSVTLTNSDSTSGTDIFLAKYSTNGNLLWAQNAVDTNYDYGCAVAVDSSGFVYQAGYYFGNSLAFGNLSIQNSGYQPVFVTKYNSDGEALWALQSSMNSWIQNLSLDIFKTSNPGMYVAGKFSGQISFGNDTIGDTGSFIARFSENSVLNSQEDISATQVTVFPNPADNILTIENAGHVIVKIFNLEGKLISATALDGNNINLDISGLHQGVFLLKFIYSDATVVKKFIKR